MQSRIVRTKELHLTLSHNEAVLLSTYIQNPGEQETSKNKIMLEEIFNILREYCGDEPIDVSRLPIGTKVFIGRNVHGVICSPEHGELPNTAEYLWVFNEELGFASRSPVDNITFRYGDNHVK